MRGRDLISDLRANERPKKKMHPMTHIDIQTDGHGDSMTNSAELVKNNFL